MAALKELKVEKGSVKVNGSIAYAAQQPWVFSGTVRQNILFGKEYNKERYKKVIKACALTTVRITQYITSFFNLTPFLTKISITKVRKQMI